MVVILISREFKNCSFPPNLTERCQISIVTPRVVSYMRPSDELHRDSLGHIADGPVQRP